MNALSRIFQCLGVVAFGNKASCCACRGSGGRSAQSLDCLPLFGRDLILSHARAALDHGLGVRLSLGYNLVCLMLGPLEQCLAVLLDGLRLLLIFGPQRLGLGAKRLGFRELVSNERDLGV